MTKFLCNKKTILMAVCALALAVVSLFGAGLLRDKTMIVSADSVKTSTHGYVTVTQSGEDMFVRVTRPASHSYVLIAIELNGKPFYDEYGGESEEPFLDFIGYYGEHLFDYKEQMIFEYNFKSLPLGCTLAEGYTYNLKVWFAQNYEGLNMIDDSMDIIYEPIVYTLPPNPSKDGYDFIGWYLNEQLTIPYQGETITKDMNFYAKFSPIVYNISYNLNGGSLTGSPNSYTIESNTFNLSEPSRTGYTFGGWYENAALTGSAVTTISKGTTGNKTYWAKWTPTNYSIVYNLNGGFLTGQIVNYTIESGNINLATPTRTGYTFNGWFSNSSLTGSAVTQIPTQSTGNKEFWAKWTINRYTINFVTNGGTAVNSITTDYGTTINQQTTTKEGHTFIGWFVNESFSTPYSFSSTISQDLTLYAKFEINKYTVTFWVDGVEYATLTVEWGSTLGTAVQQLQAKAMQFVSVPQGIDLSTQIFSNAELEVDMATEGWDKVKANIDYLWFNYWGYVIGALGLSLVVLAVIRKVRK